MIYLGIDPGLEGAIAALQADGTYIGVWDIPTIGKTETKRDYDLPALWTTLDVLNADLKGPTVQDRVHVIMEKVHAMPKQGVVAMFNFGRGLGILEAMITARRYPLTWATPRVWKTAMGFAPNEVKDAARLRAKQLYPMADLHLKKHVGRADALLIAEYGRLRHQSMTWGGSSRLS